MQTSQGSELGSSKDIEIERLQRNGRIKPFQLRHKSWIEYPAACQEALRRAEANWSDHGRCLML